jgi:hypothetical protein
MRRLLAALPVVIVLTGCGAFSATAPKAAPAGSGDVIPWIDTKPAAYHQGLAVPLGEAFPPTCRADDLTATYGGAMGATNGQLTGTVDFANVSSTPCVLQGTATVELFGAKGATLSTSLYTDTRFAAAPVVLQPVALLPTESVSAGHAWMEIDWSLYDEGGGGTCTPGPAQAAAIGITVPGGGTVTTSAVSPRNDGPITFCPPRIGVGAFQPTAPVTDFSPPPVPVYFQATMKAPSTAVVGHALTYQITLKSVYSRPLTFPNGCPGYTEDLAGPGWTLGKTWYVLNCRPMGAVIAPGASFVFAMVVQIPSSAPVGEYSLGWGMDVGDSNNNGLTATIMVTKQTP